MQSFVPLAAPIDARDSGADDVAGAAAGVAAGWPPPPPQAANAMPTRAAEHVRAVARARLATAGAHGGDLPDPNLR
jgi:hypothetical protein